MRSQGLSQKDSVGVKEFKRRVDSSDEDENQQYEEIGDNELEQYYQEEYGKQQDENEDDY